VVVGVVVVVVFIGWMFVVVAVVVCIFVGVIVIDVNVVIVGDAVVHVVV